MDGKTLIHFQRNGKDICILLKEGESLELKNIVDVWVVDHSGKPIDTKDLYVWP